MSINSILQDALLDFECGNRSEPSAIRVFQQYGYEVRTLQQVGGIVQAVDLHGEVHSFVTSASEYTALTFNQINWSY